MSAEAHAHARPKPGEFHHAHHFDNSTAQFEANKFGIWIFLVTEILFFGGMFCAFAIFRAKYFDAFVEGHDKLDKVLGATNTIVLITSSFTMALGVRSAQQAKKSLTSFFLVVTFLCASMFMVIKGIEYHHKFVEGLLPGHNFTAEGFKHPEANIFFGLYFMMTGVHGLHVLVGMGLIVWVLIRNMKGQFSGRYYAPVEGVGLYWHLVDLIWIYLFPLLYLIG